MDKPVCKVCGRSEMRRVSRRGFFQGVVMFRAGYVPWECAFCTQPKEVKAPRLAAPVAKGGSRQGCVG